MKGTTVLRDAYHRTVFQRSLRRPQLIKHGTRFYTTSLGRYADVNVNMPDKDNRERVVILGSGWGGYVLAQNLDPKKYRITIISPRTYFVFTPLLTDSAVGTLEFRHILESIRKANHKVDFIQGWADDVNFVDKIIDVEPSVLDPKQSYAPTSARGTPSEQQVIPEDEKLFYAPLKEQQDSHVPVFPVKYDKLVVAVGGYSQTFNIPGVKENAYFLKDVGDARRIRKRILELFELCHMPYITDETRRQMLHFCVVGAGPTGMEFAGNLSDLLHEDMAKIHPELMKFVKITLYDVAPKVLPMFDAALASYASKLYLRKDIDIKLSHHVEELRKGPPSADEPRDENVPRPVMTIRTKQQGEVGIGMCIWSTGLMNNPFIAKALNHVRRFPVNSADVTEGPSIDEVNPRQWIIERHPKSGGIMVDNHFRIQLQTDPEKSQIKGHAVVHDAFAIGDCTLIKGINPPLPATAQVANQEAKFLASKLNEHYSVPTHKFDADSYGKSPGFDFHNRGVMTFLGGSKAILQGPPTEKGAGSGRQIKGWLAYLIWRGAYLTLTLSWKNKFLIPIQWFTVKVFGRGVSRF